MFQILDVTARLAGQFLKPRKASEEAVFFEMVAWITKFTVRFFEEHCIEDIIEQRGGWVSSYNKIKGYDLLYYITYTDHATKLV